MADLSKIKLNNEVYNFKDAAARESIQSALSAFAALDKINVIEYTRHAADNEHDSPWYTCDHTYSEIAAMDASNYATLAVYHDGNETSTGMITYSYPDNAYLSTFYFVNQDSLNTNKKNIISHNNSNEIIMTEDYVNEPFIVTYTQERDSTVITCNKNTKDVEDAIEQGRAIQCQYKIGKMGDTEEDTVYETLISHTYINAMLMICWFFLDFRESDLETQTLISKIGVLAHAMQSENNPIQYITFPLGGGSGDVSQLTAPQVVKYEILPQDYSGSQVTISNVTYTRIDERGYNFDNDFRAYYYIRNTSNNQVLETGVLTLSDPPSSFMTGFEGAIKTTTLTISGVSISMIFEPNYVKLTNNNSVRNTNSQGLWVTFSGQLSSLVNKALEIYLVGNNLRELENIILKEKKTQENIYISKDILSNCINNYSLRYGNSSGWGSILRLSRKKIPLEKNPQIRILFDSDTIDSSANNRALYLINNAIIQNNSWGIMDEEIYSYTCPICEGAGTIGSSSSPCGTCEGAGEVECPECGGSGEVAATETCPSCEGSGEVYVETGDPCSTCDGSGWINDGEEECPNCNGSGYEPGTEGVGIDTCEMCGGTGEVESPGVTTTCSECNGSGMVTCPGCGGTGESTDGDGEESETTCEYCGGSGEITENNEEFIPVFSIDDNGTWMYSPILDSLPSNCFITWEEDNDIVKPKANKPIIIDCDLTDYSNVGFFLTTLIELPNTGMTQTIPNNYITIPAELYNLISDISVFTKQEIYFYLHANNPIGNNTTFNILFPLHNCSLLGGLGSAMQGECATAYGNYLITGIPGSNNSIAWTITGTSREVNNTILEATYNGSTLTLDSNNSSMASIWNSISDEIDHMNIQSQHLGKTYLGVEITDGINYSTNYALLSLVEFYKVNSSSGNVLHFIGLVEDEIWKVTMDIQSSMDDTSNTLTLTKIKLSNESGGHLKFGLEKAVIKSGLHDIAIDPMFMNFDQFDLDTYKFYDACCVVKDPNTGNVITIERQSPVSGNNILDFSFMFNYDNVAYMLIVMASPEYKSLKGTRLKTGYFILWDVTTAAEELIRDIPFDIDIYFLIPEEIGSTKVKYTEKIQHSIFYDFDQVKAFISQGVDLTQSFYLNNQPGWYKISDQPLKYSDKDSFMILRRYWDSSEIDHSPTPYEYPVFILNGHAIITTIVNLVNYGLSHTDVNGYDYIQITENGTDYYPLALSVEDGFYVYLPVVSANDMITSDLILTYEIDNPIATTAYVNTILGDIETALGALL